MTSKEDNLLSNIDIECSLTLPDGNRVIATKEGTTLQDGGLILRNVLYIPHLRCYLISILRLIDYLRCAIQFTDNFYTTRDKSLGNLIGANERKGGLYYYHGIQELESLCVVKEDVFDLDRIRKLVLALKGSSRSTLSKVSEAALKLSNIDLVFLLVAVMLIRCLNLFIVICVELIILLHVLHIILFSLLMNLVVLFGFLCWNLKLMWCLSSFYCFD